MKLTLRDVSLSLLLHLKPDGFSILRQASEDLVLQGEAFGICMADSKRVRRAADGRVLLVGLSLELRHGVELLRRWI
jgi:predicted lipid carrier protein YhbT